MPDPNSLYVALQPQHALKPGAVLAGKYRIEGVLGHGGMGVVLSATHLDLDAPVAIKVLREEHAHNEEVTARMLQEARASAKLRSAHIVRVLDVSHLESGAPYIVMERLEGSDLADLLATRGALPVQEAVDYLLQACEGLAEAHATGIVHRDLKPENLFVARTPEGELLKILDFGISKNVAGSLKLGPRGVLTNAGNAVGSPYYMSPEQMRASPDVDARADIWSLGAILYELVSGRCPFEGESLPVVCAQVLGNDPEPLVVNDDDALAASLWRIIRCCLEKDPEARFATATELATALREFLRADTSDERGTRLASGINLKSDGAAVSASVEPVPPRRPDRRKRWVASLVVTAALGGATAASLPVSSSKPATAIAAHPAAARPPVRQGPTTLSLITIVGQPNPVTLPLVTIVAEPPRPMPFFAARPRLATRAPASKAAPPPTTPRTATTSPTSAWDGDRFGGRY